MSGKTADFNVGGVPLSREELSSAYRAFQKFDKDESGAIDTKVLGKLTTFVCNGIIGVITCTTNIFYEGRSANNVAAVFIPI